MSKEGFEELCKDFDEASYPEGKKALGLKFKDLMGSLVNEHGVFLDYSIVKIIDHKTLEVELKYLDTPAGTLAQFNFQFRTGCCRGSCGPIALRDVAKKQFVNDLNVFVRAKMINLYDEMINADVSETALNMIMRYIKQTEQPDLFQLSRVTVLS